MELNREKENRLNSFSKPKFRIDHPALQPIVDLANEVGEELSNPDISEDRQSLLNQAVHRIYNLMQIYYHWKPGKVSELGNVESVTRDVKDTVRRLKNEFQL